MIRTAPYIGLASMPADGMKLSIRASIGHLFGLKEHQSTFVIIFGLGFAIVLTFGLKRFEFRHEKQALRR